MVRLLWLREPAQVPTWRRRTASVQHHHLLLATALTLALIAFLARAAFGFAIQGIFQFGPSHVGIAFTDSVDVAQSLQRSHYAITPQGGAPALGIQSVALQDNHRTVILTTTAALARSATYGVTVTGVTSAHGAPLDPGGPAACTTVAETVVGIADVHANINALIGQNVTILGEVFITAMSSGGTPSGYIQDGTGRGLNVFGTPPQTAADTIGNVVEATGTVGLYYSTVELTPFTAVTVASRMPALAPRVLSVPLASSSQWEGTYIQTTMTLTGPPTLSGTNNFNYSGADQGIAFIFRVRNSTGIDPSPFLGGEVVTAAGAGAVFQGTYEANVGNAFDFRRGRGQDDTTPPVLVAARGEGGATTVVLEFSEPIGVGGGVPGNYSIAPTATPSTPIAVTAASVSGSAVTLTLAAPLTAAVEYTVDVSNVQDAAGNPVAPGTSIPFVASIPVPFEVTGVFPFGSKYVGVGFSKRVNASEAIRISNYGFAPALAIAEAAIQDNGQTVILKSPSALPASASYSVTVGGITSATGEALSGAGPYSLATPGGTVTDIAALQADPASWSGQTVTVVGQTFIPVGSRGGTPSGYIQDGSGRGINVFGGQVQAAVNALGSVAVVTGMVSQFFTTLEITTYTATAVATGQPHLGAKRLTVAAANSSQWEGTYIEASATITAITASGTTNTNYDATDGGSAVTFRVGNGLGILPTQFAIGDRVTGRGAGGSFQSTYQINVGNVPDFFAAGAGGPDTVGPTVVSATGDAGSPLVTVNFSEPVESNGATLATNYRVARSGDVLNPIPVQAVELFANSRTVRLTLAQPLLGGSSYVVEVTNVVDLAGNAIETGAAVSFTPTEAAPTGARLTVPAATLIKNMRGQGELFKFEIAGPRDTKAVCRIFDMRGRLKRVLFDSKLTGSPRRTLTWDGRDDTYEFVPAGLYVCHLQITDTAGKVSQDRAPIVVAVRLE